MNPEVRPQWILVNSKKKIKKENKIKKKKKDYTVLLWSFS